MTGESLATALSEIKDVLVLFRRCLCSGDVFNKIITLCVELFSGVIYNNIKH